MLFSPLFLFFTIERNPWFAISGKVTLGKLNAEMLRLLFVSLITCPKIALKEEILLAAAMDAILL